MSEKKDQPFDRLLIIDEAANLLGVQVSTLRAWTSRKKIPCVRLLGGRAVRYRESTLERLIRAWTRPALSVRPSAPEGENGGGE